MRCSQFIKRIKLECPNLTNDGVSDEYISTVLSQGVDAVNLIVKAYKGYTDFNVVADQRVYSLAANVPLYLGTDKRGLYFLDSNSEWQQVIPKTEAWLARFIPNYLNASSVEIPQYYGLDGDDLVLYPPADASQSSGLRLYHLKKAVAMTGDNYPFTGNTTELTALQPADDAIIAYTRWKLAPAFGTHSKSEIDLREQSFLKECRKAAAQIKRRKDMSNLS